MKWILIVAWMATSQSQGRFNIRWNEVVMQEFNDIKSCQFASVKAQEIAPGIRVMCVPKGN